MPVTDTKAEMVQSVVTTVAKEASNKLLGDGVKRLGEMKDHYWPSDAKLINSLNIAIQGIIQRMTPSPFNITLPKWCQQMTDGTITKALIVSNGSVQLEANSKYLESLREKSNNEGGELYITINQTIEVLTTWADKSGVFIKSNASNASNHFIAWIIEQLLHIKSVVSDEEQLSRLQMIYEVIMFGHNSPQFFQNEIHLKKILSETQVFLKRAIQIKSNIIEQKYSDDYLKEAKELTASQVDSTKKAILATFLSKEIPKTLNNNSLRERKSVFTAGFTNGIILPALLKKLKLLEPDPQPDQDGVFYSHAMSQEGDMLIALGTKRHYCHFEIAVSIDESELIPDSYVFDIQNREFYYINAKQKISLITKYVLKSVDRNDLKEVNDTLNQKVKIEKDQTQLLQNSVLKFYKVRQKKSRSDSSIHFIDKLESLSVDENGCLIHSDKRPLKKRIATGFSPDLISIQATHKTRDIEWQCFVDMLRLLEQMQRINIIYEELRKSTKSIGEISSFIVMLPHFKTVIKMAGEQLDKLQFISDHILEIRDKYTSIDQSKHKIDVARGANVQQAANFANQTRLVYINRMRNNIEKLESRFKKNIHAVAEGKLVVTSSIRRSYETIMPIYEDMLRLGMKTAGSIDATNMKRGKAIALKYAGKIDKLNHETLTTMTETFPVHSPHEIKACLPETTDIKPTPVIVKTKSESESFRDEFSEQYKEFIFEHEFMHDYEIYFKLITAKKSAIVDKIYIMEIFQTQKKVALDDFDSLLLRSQRFLERFASTTPSVFKFWKWSERQSMLAARLTMCHHLQGLLQEKINNTISHQSVLNKQKILKIINQEIKTASVWFAPNFRRQLQFLRDGLQKLRIKKITVAPSIDIPVIALPAAIELNVESPVLEEKFGPGSIALQQPFENPVINEMEQKSIKSPLTNDTEQKTISPLPQEVALPETFADKFSAATIFSTLQSQEEAPRPVLSPPAMTFVPLRQPKATVKKRAEKPKPKRNSLFGHFADFCATTMKSMDDETHNKHVSSDNTWFNPNV